MSTSPLPTLPARESYLRQIRDCLGETLLELATEHGKHDNDAIWITEVPIDAFSVRDYASVTWRVTWLTNDGCPTQFYLTRTLRKNRASTDLLDDPRGVGGSPWRSYYTIEHLCAFIANAVAPARYKPQQLSDVLRTLAAQNIDCTMQTCGMGPTAVIVKVNPTFEVVITRDEDTDSGWMVGVYHPADEEAHDVTYAATYLQLLAAVNRMVHDARKRTR